MQQSNTYIIIFTLIMTIFFGTLLSFTRMQLGPIQKVQVEIDTKKKILGAVMDISSLNPDEILSLYSKKMTSVVLDISGNEISPVGGESIIAEQVNIQKWIGKWGRLPDHDSETFVVPITDTNVPTKLKWESFDETN